MDTGDLPGTHGGGGGEGRGERKGGGDAVQAHNLLSNKMHETLLVFISRSFYTLFCSFDNVYDSKMDNA